MRLIAQVELLVLRKPCNAHTLFVEPCDERAVNRRIVVGEGRDHQDIDCVLGRHRDQVTLEESNVPVPVGVRDRQVIDCLHISGLPSIPLRFEHIPDEGAAGLPRMDILGTSWAAPSPDAVGHSVTQHLE